MIVRRSLFQPIILKPSLRAGQRLVATPTLLVATDRRLILIREIPHTHTARYGQHTCSLPRYRAGDLSVRLEKGFVVLEYAPDPAVLRVVLDGDGRPALQQLLTALHAQRSSPLLHGAHIANQPE